MDIQDYLKLQQWTLIEAACLISGIEPVAEEVFDKALETGGKPAFLYRQFKDAIKLEQLRAWDADGTWQRLRVLPEEAVSWAKLHGHEIPEALEGLVFLVRGINGHGHMNQRAYEEHQASLDARRSQGRYTLEEAALAIEAATGERADAMLKKLMAAAWSGALPVYEPGKNARYLYGPGHASHVREFYEEACWDDLNTWLNDKERRITWRFPNPSGKATSATDKVISSKHSDDWKDQARAIADELFDQDTANNCRDCLLRKTKNGDWGGYAARVMDEMQIRKIHGPRGRITNPGTISRDALQGNLWWSKKSK